MLVFTLGGPAYIPLAMCAQGSTDAKIKQAFGDAATWYQVAGAISGLAGLVPSPATPFLLIMSPCCLALGAICAAASQGRAPSASDLAAFAGPAAQGLAAVGGDPTGGKAAEMGGAFAALAELADETGLAPTLPTFVQPANTPAARDAKKNLLKRHKARAKAIALAKAKKLSRRSLQDCRDRGGVFDGTTPDGCRIVGGGGGSPPKKTAKASGGGKLALAGIGLALAKALLG